MTQPVRVAILFSARGSNMQRLAHHLAKPSVGAEFVLAITNRPAAAGIKFCKAQGVACAVIDHEDYKTRAGFEAEMQKALDKAQVELICAAGFRKTCRVFCPTAVRHILIWIAGPCRRFSTG